MVASYSSAKSVALVTALFFGKALAETKQAKVASSILAGGFYSNEP